MSSTLLRDKLWYPLIGGIANFLFFLMELLPFEFSSHLGGWIARSIGPHLKISNIARDNLRQAFSEKTQDEIEEIVKGMWDNLGRTAFEFPHLANLNIYEHPDRFELIGVENITKIEKLDRGIFYSGHMGNWEFGSLGIAQHDPPIVINMIYREPNNPYMRKLFAKRKPTQECVLIPKGAKGARQAYAALAKGGYVGMLLDQKMNDGIAVPFFGRDAMTAPAMAHFAMKFDCPIMPVRIERVDKVKFRITFCDLVYVEKTDDKNADTFNAMRAVNKNFEDWIAAKPEQWLWLHKRWPKD